MRTAIRVKTTTMLVETKDELILEWETYYYTNLKKAIIESGLNYNTLKKYKLPFEYKGFQFEKVEIK